VLGNTLVCLAVWLTLSARSTADRVLVIVPPISAFVATGFEHSMYFIPYGLLIASLDGSFAATAMERSFPALTWGAFLGRNLLPVTIGNIIGGAGLVGLVYWFVYLRPPAARGPRP
jgi:formate/nitrite transporter FocA (FNT family)